MAFTVKDEELIRLADELMKRLQLSSRVEAIRHALKAQIDVTQSCDRSRADDLLEVIAG